VYPSCHPTNSVEELNGLKAMVDGDGSSHLLADSQPKSVGFAATRRSVCNHQMNRVNSHSDHGHDDSTINTVITIIIKALTSAREITHWTHPFVIHHLTSGKGDIKRPLLPALQLTTAFTNTHANHDLFCSVP